MSTASKTRALAQQAVARFEDRSAVIGVWGLGYVGLPLALRFTEAGLKVIGFDIDPVKAQKIKAGKSYINYIPDSAIRTATKAGFTATSDASLTKKCDALIICVPTPLDKHRRPDLSYVVDTAKAMAPHLKRGQLVSLESTTWPGTTEEVVQPIVEAHGLEVGRDLFLAFSPERQDPGNPKFDTRNIPKLVGGVTPDCLAVAQACYAKAVDRVVAVSSTRVAELAKLLENIHRAVNIGLVNEMKIVAERMGIDIFEVIDAAATKPFGFVPYYPGPGLGGHCIPIDPFYLTWKAHEFGVHTRFIELAGEINSAMPEYVVLKLTEGMNAQGRAIKGSRILLLGIAYKKNVDDLRESPSLELLEKLEHLGARVDYSDPHIPAIPPIRRGHFPHKSVKLTAKTVASYDCVLLATAHDAFDYDLIAKHAKLIVDTRGIYRKPRKNVVKA
ncbi:MAG TPA: nucleotide sugar dehydrogenase [Nevskiaceae bacterium]|nr:nucleotide sugar dehydrogenase [Nevskiaceae bacterium]